MDRTEWRPKNAPALKTDFEKAALGEAEREPSEPKAEMHLRPGGPLEQAVHEMPAPGGAQVSPQLREGERLAQEFRSRMLTREFNRARGLAREREEERER